MDDLVFSEPESSDASSGSESSGSDDSSTSKTSSPDDSSSSESSSSDDFSSPGVSSSDDDATEDSDDEADGMEVAYCTGGSRLLSGIGKLGNAMLGKKTPTNQPAAGAQADAPGPAPRNSRNARPGLRYKNKKRKEKKEKQPCEPFLRPRTPPPTPAVSNYDPNKPFNALRHSQTRKNGRNSSISYEEDVTTDEEKDGTYDDEYDSDHSTGGDDGGTSSDQDEPGDDNHGYVVPIKV